MNRQPRLSSSAWRAWLRSWQTEMQRLPARLWCHRTVLVAATLALSVVLSVSWNAIDVSASELGATIAADRHQVDEGPAIDVFVDGPNAYADVDDAFLASMRGLPGVRAVDRLSRRQVLERLASDLAELRPDFDFDGLELEARDMPSIVVLRVMADADLAQIGARVRALEGVRDIALYGPRVEREPASPRVTPWSASVPRSRHGPSFILVAAWLACAAVCGVVARAAALAEQERLQVSLFLGAQPAQLRRGFIVVAVVVVALALSCVQACHWLSTLDFGIGPLNEPDYERVPGIWSYTLYPALWIAAVCGARWGLRGVFEVRF